MTRSTVVLVAAAALALMLPTSAAWSMDVYGADVWFRGEANTTMQHWQFTTNTMTDIEPEDWVNPYGTPLATLTATDAEWRSNWEAPPDLVDPPDDGIPGWHMPEGGTVIHLLFNTPIPNASKVIIAQVTSSKEPTSVYLELPEGITYVPIDVGMPTVLWGLPAPFDGEWATYVYAFDLSKNPEWEGIVIEYPPCTTLDQTVVDSICIPEPATVGLLAAGLAALALRRRRR